MRANVIKPFKKKGVLIKAGEVIEITASEYERLKGYVEPVKEIVPSKVKLPIYIKEFTYNNKTLRDVLIISEEQLQVCLKDRYYGDVFREVIKSNDRQSN